MANTLNNIPLDKGEWVEVYSQASLSSTESITIQNIGNTDVYYSVSDLEPSLDYSKHNILKRGEFLETLADDTTLWVTSPYNNGLINPNGTIVTQQVATTASGDVPVSESTPITQVSASNGLLPDVLTAILGGTISVLNGMYQLSCGTAIGNVTTLLSAREARHRAGQGLFGIISAAFNSPLNGLTQQAGLITSESGYTFGYIDEEFGIIQSYDGALEIQELTILTPALGSVNASVTVDGVLYLIPVTVGTVELNAYQIATYLNAQNTLYRFSSNGAKVTTLANVPDVGTGLFDFSLPLGSGSWTQIAAGALPTEVFIPQSNWNKSTKPDLIPTNINYYKIQTQGNVNFYIKDVVTGLYVLVHVIEQINSITEPTIKKPTFRIGWGLRNVSNIVNATIKGSYAAMMIQGEVLYNQVPNGVSNTITGVDTTATNIISFRNRSTFNNSANRSEVIPLLLAFGTDSGKPAIFDIISNPTVGATDYLSWEYLNKSDSLIEVAKNSVAVTGTVVSSFVVSTSSVIIDINKLVNHQVPTAVFSVSARTTQGAASSMVVSGTWKEDV